MGNSREIWRKRIEREMSEIDETWKGLRWLTQDKFEWQELVCAYVSQGTECEGRR